MESKRQELFSLLSSAVKLSNELKDELSTDPVFRAAAVKSSKSLLDNIQTPPEKAWEMFLQADICPLLRMAVDAGWLSSIAQASPAGITAQDLTNPSGHDPSLAARILRCLSAVKVVEEVGIKTYAPNAMTHFLLHPGMRAGLIHMSENNSRVIGDMPEYFQRKNYNTQIDIDNYPFFYSRGMTMWESNRQNPVVGEAFNKFMDVVRGLKKDWFRVLPEERLLDLQPSSPDAVLLIDIGGGLGHDITAFDARRRELEIPGKLILQDQPSVLEKVPPEWKSNDSLTLVPHDFFTPQPSAYAHARIYYFRMILHDWADGAAIKILEHVRDAMEVGYSKLLVNDIVLPDRGCPFFESSFDIAMLTMVSGKERTRLEWEALVGGVKGLRIEKVWALEEGANFESLIEIVRTE